MFGVVEGDPIVAGQGQLKAAAESRAIERGGHGHAPRLQLAKACLERFGVGKQFGRIGGGVQALQVAARHKRLLGRGDNDPREGASRLVGRQLAQRFGQGTAEFTVNHIGRPPRHVEGQRDDIVGIFVVVKHLDFGFWILDFRFWIAGWCVSRVFRHRFFTSYNPVGTDNHCVGTVADRVGTVSPRVGTVPPHVGTVPPRVGTVPPHVGRGQ